MEKVKSLRQKFQELPAYFRWAPVPIITGVIHDKLFDCQTFLVTFWVALAVFVYAWKAPADKYWSKQHGHDYQGGALVALLIVFASSVFAEIIGHLL